MKTPVICICPNPQPIQELFYMLRKKFTATVSARLEYFPEVDFLNVSVNQKLAKPDAVVCYETPVDQLSSKAIKHLLNPTLETDYNGHRNYIEEAQIFIGTYQKPLLMPKLEKKFLFYVVPEDATAEILKYLYKIIWLDLNRKCVPALSLKSVEAKKLVDYYAHKKAYYYNKIDQLQNQQQTAKA